MHAYAFTASHHIAVQEPVLPCVTNPLVNARPGRRIAQAALNLCGSLEQPRDLGTCPTFISLNAELVACRTSTPGKLRQHKRRFWRSRDCDCFSRFKCFSAKLQSHEEGMPGKKDEVAFEDCQPSTLFREFAAECIELAQTVSSPSKHALYMKMASVWHQMAQRWENKNQPSP